MKVFLLILALLVTQASPTRPPLTDPDAYAIFAVVIPSEWPVRVAGAKQLLIQDTTVVDSMMKDCPLTAPDLKDGWAEAVADFHRQNATTWTLLREFPLEIPYALESEDAITAHFRGRGPSGWTGFHAAHPETHGYLHLSAIGFDTGKSRAIVYVSHFCGGLCGGGAYHFLQREEGTWRFVQPNVKACSWIS